MDLYWNVFVYIYYILKGTDEKLISPSLEMLKFLIRTSTTSMTSVPKPLKYLAPYYLQIKEGYKKIKDVNVKKLYADVVSVLAMSQPEDLNSKIFDCLKYCLLGNKTLLETFL